LALSSLIINILNFIHAHKKMKAGRMHEIFTKNHEKNRMDVRF